MNTDGLIEILSWARPHDSETEQRFCREFLDTVPGMQKDAFGNRMCRIGTDKVLWSCHVDTVAKRGGPQAVSLDADGIASLAAGKPGMSLGADDGAGVWIMLSMIAAGRPGLYVFHRGEEVGCLGSAWIVENTPELLTGIDAAVAFDRAGHRDIITHQISGRTCSDAFAQSFADELSLLGGGLLAYRPDDGGVYTDTNEYAHIIPECSNVSVGYRGQHGPRETLDVVHCARLLNAMLNFDFAKMKIERDPTAPDRHDFDWHRTPKRRADKLEDYASVIETYPYVAAQLLTRLGVSLDDFVDETWGDGAPWEDHHYKPLVPS